MNENMNSTLSDKELKSSSCPPLSINDKQLRVIPYLKEISTGLHDYSKEITLLHVCKVEFLHFSFLLNEVHPSALFFLV